MLNDIKDLNVKLTTAENTRKAGYIDLDNPQTLSRLVDCLLFSCVTDDTTGNSNNADKLYLLLGQTEPCCNHDALSRWVKYETQYSTYTDAIVLFNTLAIQFDEILYESGAEI